MTLDRAGLRYRFQYPANAENPEELFPGVIPAGYSSVLEVPPPSQPAAESARGGGRIHVYGYIGNHMLPVPRVCVLKFVVVLSCTTIQCSTKCYLM